MAVRPFRGCENALRHRSTHAPAKAREQINGDRTFALAHQSKARTADIMESIPDPKSAQALKPRRNAIHSKATE